MERFYSRTEVLPESLLRRENARVVFLPSELLLQQQRPTKGEEGPRG